MSTSPITLHPSAGAGAARGLLGALLERRSPGYSLEAPFYLDERVFQADMELIFRRHWIFVAVSPQVPEPGSYVTVNVGADSILIVRDDDMRLQAFHNVCRHRGSRLCQDHQGSLGNIVCPYHQWTYDLAGKLIHVEHMGDDFLREQHSLKRVHLRDLEGLIFVCLADEPPADFEEVAARLRPYLAPHRLDDCKVAAQVDIIEKGNWKLTLENNRECYHCMSNHPELTISLYEQGFGYQAGSQSAEGVARFERIVEESHARWEAMGLPSAQIDELATRVTGFRTQRLPLDRAGQSQTMNSEVASKKLLGQLSEKALGGLSVWTQPNSWHHFMSDHVVSFSTIPLSATETLVRTTWCVHKDAVEGVDYDVKNLTAVWNATNNQDRALVEAAQLGAASSAYEPGPYSPYTEGLVEAFAAWYVGRMRDGLAADAREAQAC